MKINDEKKSAIKLISQYAERFNRVEKNLKISKEIIFPRGAKRKKQTVSKENKRRNFALNRNNRKTATKLKRVKRQEHLL